MEQLLTLTNKDNDTLTQVQFQNEWLNTYWPASAYYVPVSDAANLQARINTYGSVRLDAADYTVGGPSSLTLTTNQRIYGLQQGSKSGPTNSSCHLPPVTIRGGSSGVVISGVATFGGSQRVTFGTDNNSAPITNCTFCRISFTIFWSAGATVDNCLFLDCYECQFLIDNSGGVGTYTNNRHLRTVAQNNVSEISIKGNPTAKGFGNIFVFHNFLQSMDGGIGTPNCYIDNQTEVTFIGCDTEISSATSGTVFSLPSSVGSFRFMGGSGNQNAGGTRFTLGCPQSITLSDIGNQTVETAFLATDLLSATLFNFTQSTNTDAAVNPTRFSLYDNSLGQVTSAPKLNGSAAGVLSGVNALKFANLLYPARTDGLWANPVWAASPANPAGPNFALGFAGTFVDSTAYIQGLINNAANTAHGVAILPPGIYYISSSLVINDHQGLVGGGSNNTAIVATSAIDMIITTSSSGGPQAITLAGLTLQGGANGIHWTGLAQTITLQMSNCVIKDVVFRDMTANGMYLDRIYGFDNNLIDHCDFINCPYGIHQFATNDSTYLGYIDKLIVFHCRFIGCVTGGVYYNGFRANNLHVYLDCLFADNGFAATITNSNNMHFVNCVFRNNGGNPSLSFTGSNGLVCVGCYWQADAAGVAMVAGATIVSLIDCTFKLGSSTTARMFGSFASWNNLVMWNCNSIDMPTGTGNWNQYASFINSHFGGGDQPSLSVGWAYTVNTVVTQAIATAAAPSPQILRGRNMPILTEMGMTPDSYGPNPPSALPKQAYPMVVFVAQGAGDGGSAVSGSWLLRPLTAIINDDTGAATLVSSQFTLPAGKYRVSHGWSNFYNVSNAALKLVNVTAAADVVFGAVTGMANNTSNNALLGFATFTSNGTDLYQLDYLTSASQAGLGLGVGVSGPGLQSIYRFCEFAFEKIG